MERVRAWVHQHPRFAAWEMQRGGAPSRSSAPSASAPLLRVAGVRMRDAHRHGGGVLVASTDGPSAAVVGEALGWTGDAGGPSARATLEGTGHRAPIHRIDVQLQHRRSLTGGRRAGYRAVQDIGGVYRAVWDIGTRGQPCRAG